MQRGFIRIAALLGALTVLLGAFAAHRLKQLVSPDLLDVFDTAVRYQFYHVFALLLTGILYRYGRKKTLRWAGIFFISGIILFCGSLYLITWVKTADIGGVDWLGPLTPLGGLCFVTGWILMAVGIARQYNRE
jgi:uncharacterized membrane protein YgdD (TMEM256/DUF423 family)